MARRKKKVAGGHGHHGGAGKVAYADFVTAMMALFMVLWLLASTDAASRKEISMYFRTGVLPEGSLATGSGIKFTTNDWPVDPKDAGQNLRASIGVCSVTALAASAASISPTLRK